MKYAGESFEGGELSQKQAEARDFQEYFQKQTESVAPIRGVFSPEDELAGIRSLPKEEKEQSLKAFKQDLARQREAWAVCRNFIERILERNPDAPKSDLMDWVEKFGLRYGFSDKQKGLAEKVIDAYQREREKAWEIRERYPDDLELVKALTGIDFDESSEFRASVGPMGIEIRADATEASCIWHAKRGLPLPPNPDEFKPAATTYPAQGNNSTYIVFNESKREGRSVAVHERTHLKNSLFEEIFDREITSAELKRLYALYDAEKDSQAKRELLREYFNVRLEKAWKYVKNEIIAMKTQEQYESRPLNYSVFYREDIPSYDYLAQLKKKSEKMHDAMWQEEAREMLVDRYRTVIRQALEAFERLEQEGRYRRERAIAMLTDKPLSEWPKTVQRILSSNR